MSRLFYDHLMELQKLENYIEEICENHEEKGELWNIVDEIIHHRVLGCVLDHLPRKHHDHFLVKYKDEPHNLDLLVFVQERVEDDIEDKIKRDIRNLQEELLRELAE